METWEEKARGQERCFISWRDLEFGRLHARSLWRLSLELSSRTQEVTGERKRILLLYQSLIRRKWFDALECGKGFNIALIEDDLVWAIADEVNDRIWKREIDEVRTQA